MNFFLIKEWLAYFHLKTDEHSLHSPFFFNFYLNVIRGNTESSEFKEIENKRSELKLSKYKIQLNDLGAGSKTTKSTERAIEDIAKNSLSSAKFSQLLYRIILKFQFTEIVELGTCLGINTGYMASTNPKSKIVTFEGDKNLLDFAEENLKSFTNIQFILGNINKTLPEFLNQQKNKIDLVYIDANHTYEATINYFHQLLSHHHPNSIFILDDIHWSAGMRKAWEEIKQHEAVTSSIDIFDAGLLFFNPDFQKQHYILSF